LAAWRLSPRGDVGADAGAEGGGDGCGETSRETSRAAELSLAADGAGSDGSDGGGDGPTWCEGGGGVAAFWLVVALFVDAWVGLARAAGGAACSPAESVCGDEAEAEVGPRSRPVGRRWDLIMSEKRGELAGPWLCLQTAAAALQAGQPGRCRPARPDIIQTCVQAEEEQRRAQRRARSRPPARQRGAVLVVA
jgi:hypothetical protein